MERNKKFAKTNKSVQSPFSQTFFHGTKADLRIGDLIEIGITSNYGQKQKVSRFFINKAGNNLPILSVL